MGMLREVLQHVWIHHPLESQERTGQQERHCSMS